MVMYLLVHSSMLPLLRHVDSDINNSEYLQLLLALKKKQRFLDTAILSMYFFLLSAGLSLYLFEYVSRMTLLWGTLTYSITIGFIGVHWFIFRPRAVRKQQEKINLLIRACEGVRNQLDDLSLPQH